MFALRKSKGTERCPSGRRSTPGKCVNAKSVSRVRIPSSLQQTLFLPLFSPNSSEFGVFYAWKFPNFPFYSWARQKKLKSPISYWFGSLCFLRFNTPSNCSFFLMRFSDLYTTWQKSTGWIRRITFWRIRTTKNTTSKRLSFHCYCSQSPLPFLNWGNGNSPNPFTHQSYHQTLQHR